MCPKGKAEAVWGPPHPLLCLDQGCRGWVQQRGQPQVLAPWVMGRPVCAERCRISYLTLSSRCSSDRRQGNSVSMAAAHSPRSHQTACCCRVPHPATPPGIGMPHGRTVPVTREGQLPRASDLGRQSLRSQPRTCDLWLGFRQGRSGCETCAKTQVSPKGGKARQEWPLLGKAQLRLGAPGCS